MACILIVDDEQDMREAIAYNLERAGHQVLLASDGLSALNVLEGVTPDVIISDVMMPGMDGLAFCEEVRAHSSTALVPFLFVTAKGQADDKLAGLRAGADDYITKPFELPDLLARVNGRMEQRARSAVLERRLSETQARWTEAVELNELVNVRREQTRIAQEARSSGYRDYEPPLPEIAHLKHKLQRLEQRFPGLAELRRSALVGEAACLLSVFEDVVIAAQSADPVLIMGATGTGKTAVAEAVARLGARADQAYRTLNCAELASGDPTIATGRLFGYGKSSGLTHLPKEGQRGLLEEAHSGVLFLDEIAELPRQAQMLLLLPLEGRPFSPAAGTGPERKVDVKFVCATNKDLEREVEQGAFPRDLYERLAANVIRIPPLCERLEDLPLLVTHFLREVAEPNPPLETSHDVLLALASHAWPGNVRELRRVLRQAAQRAQLRDAQAVGLEDLPRELLAKVSVPPPGVKEHGVRESDAEERAAPASQPMSRPEAPSNSSTAHAALRAAGFSEREAVEILTLRATGLRVGEAEAALGYSRKSRTFSHRLRGILFKALSLAAWDPDRAAVLIAGSEATLKLSAARRLRSLLDSVAARSDEPEEKLLTNLLFEHRRYALEARALHAKH